jgi:hydrogenase maturation protein HypF
MEELFDTTNRRYQYPFTNCTLCGPRYTIIRDIPYDRSNTTMCAFKFCPDCRREYTDPVDRRFHAQPNACPVCGPRLSIALDQAADALRQGRILALKGIGGFQLLVDARNPEAVRRLRERKRREEKPFAVMMPSLDVVRSCAKVSLEEEDLLRSTAAPIVLLDPLGGGQIAPNVSLDSPFLGVMLPYSPLHHLLLRAFPHPVVATSGNRSDEPIAIDDSEAAERLGCIADLFLTHNRPVARPCDDSVARISRGALNLIRRARGYAPLPIRVREELPSVLAVGGHLKSTVAIAIGKQVYLSQHIGDLDTLEARRGFERAIEDLCRLYRFQPEAVVCDLHPDYASSQWARASGLPVIAVQHHHAHLAACAAENDVTGGYLGVSWDGTGYGIDGTIWGGEIFLADGGRFERVGHLRSFRLPGGEAAIREAWRSAASVQVELGLPSDAPPVILQMLERGVNSPVTTSAGRLFDAVAVLAGVARENHFEGQAAMQLERAIGSLRVSDAYPLPNGDWEPLVRGVLDDVRRGVAPGLVSARFHNALAEWIVAAAREAGIGKIILSGGVFQNRYLSERTAALAEAAGFALYTHQRVPANDGGISLGQAVLSAD